MDHQPDHENAEQLPRRIMLAISKKPNKDFRKNIVIFRWER
jgi:hypothetical protein